MNTRIAILSHTIASGAVAAEAHRFLEEGRVRVGPPGRDWAIVATAERWHVVRVFERGVTCSCSRAMNTVCAHAAAALIAWTEPSGIPHRFEPEQLEQLELVVADLEAVAL